MYSLVLISVWQGKIKQIKSDAHLFFCIVLEWCQNEALDFTNCISMPSGILLLATPFPTTKQNNNYNNNNKRNTIKIGIRYCAESCVLSHHLHNSVCLIITVLKNGHLPHHYGWKMYSIELVFFTQEVFYMIFRNTELLTHYPEVSG